MKNIYEMTKTGLRLIKFAPKRWYHLTLGEVIFLCGLSVLIGIIGSEWVITRYLPKVTCTQYTCEHNKLKVK
jgi:hypothetical protein